MTEAEQGSTLGNTVDPGQAPHESDFRTGPQTIETYIRQTREEAAAAVDELVDRTRPANRTKALKDRALGVVDVAWETVTDAITGDDTTRKEVGIMAGAIAGSTLLTLRRWH